ncbi:trypsin-like peptidase domain-containing protein [Anaerobacillus sp. CMMVII]|uniref:S1C family serine protease n=1 Tax=Anaerobacillus sp. CMMVII TaxID=2755588 RepID=UPI0021B832EA|nr:S1C family serine protease [Anaerobacillus sp. CMMVII]MCT8137697.1 trypsin-like peptidase domain-containing protein [Anaerobacillus sp. CMMVII]
MTNRRRIPILLTIFILFGAITGFRYLDQFFEKYSGNGISALAPIKHSERVEVAGTIINESSIDLKEVIRKNQPNVVQIEREDGELGSGFLYNDKGDIITNAHIVEGASTVLVRMPDTQTYYGTVIGVGEVIDVAVVRVPELETFEPMNIAFEYQGEVGDGVVAMGSPRGFQNTVTTGIISATNRDFALPPYQFDKVYQISAPIAPGSSGGPLLLAATGEVIGINSAAYQGEVIGFSIPIKNIWSLVTAWSDGEYPEEPLSYYRMLLDEEEASYLVYYFFESITNHDYVTAYSLLGSDWQSSVTYDDFRASYQTTYAVDLLGTETTMVDDVVNVSVELEVFERVGNGEITGNIHEVHFQIGIENDKMKILDEE